MSLLALFIIFILGNISLSMTVISLVLNLNPFAVLISLSYTICFYLIFWMEIWVKNRNDEPIDPIREDIPITTTYNRLRIVSDDYSSNIPSNKR